MTFQKYTYIYSLHFVQPIDESSDPIISTVQATTGRKRKAREQLMVEEGSGPGETDVNLEQSLELESLSVDKSTQTKDNSHLVNQLKIRYLDCQISLMKKAAWNRTPRVLIIFLLIVTVPNTFWVFSQNSLTRSLNFWASQRIILCTLRQNMPKMAKIREDVIFEKRPKTHLLHQKSSVWAKNQTKTAKPCYLEILLADFPFFDFSQNGGHF